MVKFFKRLLRRGMRRDKYQIINKDGINMLLNYKNHIDRKLLREEIFEEPQLEFLCRAGSLAGATVFFDIGANIGLYTLTLCRTLKLKRVCTFEPSMANRYQLQANLLINGLEKEVEVYSCALSDSNGVAAFLENKGNSTGRSRIKETNQTQLDNEKFTEILIPLERLDDLISLRNETLLLKIDVEGHEEKVLGGMPDLLRHNDCVIQVEIFEQARKKLFENMNLTGYSLIHQIGNDHFFCKDTLKELIGGNSDRRRMQGNMASAI